MPRPIRDLAGLRFGRLTVLRLSPGYVRGEAMWVCQCECGSSLTTRSSSLTKGYTKSCGCLALEVQAKTHVTHGRTGTREYRSYRGAKSRCQLESVPQFRHYGGRGIEFRFTSFDQFFAELGKCPPGMSLDRINNDGHYEPGNVRWATVAQQNNNKRENITVTAFGDTLTVAQWAKKLGLPFYTIRGRLSAGRPPEEALSTKRWPGRRPTYRP